MNQASPYHLHRAITLPLVLVYLAALLMVLLGSGDGPYRQLAGLLTIGLNGFMLAHRVSQIANRTLAFTYIPTRSGRDTTELEALFVSAGLTVAGVGVFRPELNQTMILSIALAPAMVGACNRGYRWLDDR
jgi:hypothetical protein